MSQAIVYHSPDIIRGHRFLARHPGMGAGRPVQGNTAPGARPEQDVFLDAIRGMFVFGVTGKYQAGGKILDMGRMNEAFTPDESIWYFNFYYKNFFIFFYYYSNSFPIK